MGAPDFLIVGAAKSGTTSLSNYLSAHPDVVVVSNRLEFFGEYRNPASPRISIEEYERLFDGYDPGRVLGEKSVSYLYSDAAPHEIRKRYPDVRIFMILRDPVERAYSDYWHRRRTGVENLDFPEALQAEQNRIRDGARFELHYANYGLYAGRVERYLKLFGRDAVRVFLFEELKEAPGKVCSACFDALGVDPDFQLDDFAVHNEGARGDVDWLVGSLYWMARTPWIVSAVRGVVPDSVRSRVTSWMRDQSAGGDYPPMDAGVEKTLREFFRDDIEKLESVLGRDLSGWKA